MGNEKEHEGLEDSPNFHPEAPSASWFNTRGWNVTGGQLPYDPELKKHII
jgi:hypothetical protein